MKAEFVKFAKDVFENEREIVDYWSKSTDILDRAIAAAIMEAVEVQA